MVRADGIANRSVPTTHIMHYNPKMGVWRSFLLMVVPSVALLSVGWWLVEKPRPLFNQQISSLFLYKSQVVPLSPGYQSAPSHNYSLCVRLTLQHQQSAFGNKQKTNNWRFTDSCILDSQGRKLPVKLPYPAVDAFDWHLQQDPVEHQWATAKDGLYRVNVWIPVDKIPAHGDFFYSTQVSINREPPLKIKIPLFKRIEWVRHAASNFDFEEFSLISLSDNFHRIKHEGDIEVQGKFRYTGQKRLSASIAKSGLPWEETYPFNGIDYLPPALEQGTVRLFTKWNVKVLDGANKAMPVVNVSYNSKIKHWMNRVNVHKISYDETTRTGTIYYRVHEDNLPSKGALWLRSTLAVEGDGFFCFSTLIRNPNGKWIHNKLPFKRMKAEP